MIIPLSGSPSGLPGQRTRSFHSEEAPKYGVDIAAPSAEKKEQQ